VSKNGNEWQLDIGIDQSSGYYEIPCQTRKNNSDQKSLADFEGRKKDPSARNKPSIKAQGRSYRQGRI